jgi:hypothetical protein
MQKLTRCSLQVMTGMTKILDQTPRTLPHPLLIVTGEQDLPIILSNAQDWQRRERSAQLQIIPHAGHCANMNNPSAFNQVLAEFIGLYVNQARSLEVVSKMVIGKFPQVDIGVWLRHTPISTCGFLPIVIFEMASSHQAKLLSFYSPSFLPAAILLWLAA